MDNCFRSGIWLIVFVTVTAHTNGQGFLKANGKTIVNEKGQTVLLRCMGLGGWLLQEGYMFHLGNIGTQHRIRESIADVVGEERTKQFYEAWLANHTTKTDIDSMAAWGFNSIRLPLHYNLFTLPVEEEPVAGKQTWLEKGFAITDSVLNWCRSKGIYVMLDMHAAPGGQGNDLNISDRNPGKPSLWDSEANRQKLIALWSQLAKRYASEPYIGGYDIINEPNWGFTDSADKRGTAEKMNVPLKQLLVDLTNAIRAEDKKHIIIIEGNGFGNNYNGIMPPWDNNLVLSFHKYGNFNYKANIQNYLNFRDTYNIPVWLGESGENSNTWFTECINLVEENGIGWAWWPLKKMGINNPLEINVPEGYDQLLNYWRGKGAKPDTATAWRVLQQVISNVKIQNNKVHRDVLDAMFRQVQMSTTLPFAQHIIGKGTTLLPAVEVDLGKQGAAYYDRDSASYHFTPGVHTQGNKGWTYRNDGVDIMRNDSGVCVFSIEDGEWLQYTIQAKVAGKYQLGFKTAAEKSVSQLSLQVNENWLVNKLTLPVTGGDTNFTTTWVQHIFLPAGVTRLKVLADKGGFNLQSISFIKE
ncbi:MAG TPA: cellulase family glycosylhydrolase [Niastella sp.]